MSYLLNKQGSSLLKCPAHLFFPFALDQLLKNYMQPNETMYVIVGNKK